MSLLKEFLDGSLFGRERLLEAREFYAPERSAATPELAFAKWTQRLVVQTELGGARELAGLSDAELSVLDAEFTRCQTRPSSPFTRGGIIAGVLLIGLGCLSFAIGQWGIGLEAVASRALAASGVILLLAGVASIAFILLAGINASNLDLSYGMTGLYVGELDEQHPWLYKAMSLMRHEAAASYRRRVLADRGRLRGVDYVMMRELVRAQDTLEQTRPARLVAEQLQSAAPQLGTAPPEPRLVQIGTGAS